MNSLPKTKEKSVSKLIQHLKWAEDSLSKRGGGCSGNFLSAEEFHKALKDCIRKLEAGDESVIDDLLVWFAPTGAWDDFDGDIELGERILQQLYEIEKGQ